MPEQHEAVVIGAGPNGLAAAIALARAGRDVLVVEAAARLGGAVATEELTLPGFHHDVFSSVYPAAAASPVFARMPLERHGLRWVHPELPMAHPLPDGRAAVLARDVGETAASLDALGAGDGRRWSALVAPLLERFEPLRATMLAGFPPIAGPARLLAGLGSGGALELARLVLLSAEGLAGDLFGGEGAAWLYGSALHGDVALDSAGSAIFAVYLNVLGHAVGWPSPAGGAARLAEALTGHLHGLGGRARTRARAVRVRAARGRVTGVEFEDGELVAARLVLCDTSPRGLLELAGADLPDAYVRRMARFRHGPATLKLDWALDGPIPWRNLRVGVAGTVHVGGEAAAILESLDQVRAGLEPERPVLLLGQPSAADPSRAPQGRHTAWAYTHVPHGLDWSDERVRERNTAGVEAQIERFAPGFRDLVLGRHVLAPPDLQARDANLIGGDVGGGSHALDQLVFRPLPSLSPYRTPLRGLYIGSASTFPGGGVHGVPGDAAARAALRDERLRPWRRRTAPR